MSVLIDNDKMSPTEWLNNLNDLKHRVDQLAHLLKDKKVSYIDIPLHNNVGDILIYLGTEAMLKEHSVNVSIEPFKKI